MNPTVVEWPVRPMEPVSRPNAFNSADTLFQVKWDGVRVLTYIYPGGAIRLFNRQLHERTVQYPELQKAFTGAIGGTVLDGEIVALGADGKPDFPRVLQRDLVRSDSKIRLLTQSVPVHYMVFDILWLNGEALYNQPLSQRMEILEEIAFPSETVQMVESVPEKGIPLFEAVKAEGMEGIVAKKADSPYRIGKKTELWQKIKCFRTMRAVVGGFLKESPERIKSLMVGIPQEEGIRYIGTAASGVTQKEWQVLGELFEDIPGPCPFINPPGAYGVHWVKPVLQVDVRFLEYTGDGVMRAPSIIGFPESNI